MAICSHCGTQYADTAAFCPKCGQSSGEVSPPPIRTNTARAAGKQPPRRVTILLVAVAAFALFWFFIRKDPVKDLKNHVFLDYGSASFGTVVDTIFIDPQWSSSGSSGSYTVTCAATIAANPCSFTFHVSYIGSTPVVQLLSCTIGSDSYTDSDYLLNDLYWSYEQMLSNPTM